MIGKLEISAARDEAKKMMGSRFDIKAFHDQVLEDGGVPISSFARRSDAWAGASQ